MDIFKELIKNKYFYYAKVVGEFIIDKAIYEEYKKLPSVSKIDFELVPLPQEETKEPITYRFRILIPNCDQFSQSDIEAFLAISNFFETKIKEKQDFFSRVMFHYPSTAFVPDPPLPVVLDEKKGAFGKIVLKGLRVTFPDYPEIDSIIVDVQGCSHCKEESIFIEVFTERKTNYSFEYLKEVISKSESFSKDFIKERVIAK